MSILVDHFDGVLEIRLNRPDKLNALTLAMARELLACVDDGLQKAKGMLMLGREVSATDAERWGLIWTVTNDERLVTQARDQARQLAATDPSILGAMKTLLHQETIGDIAEALHREAQAHDKLGGRPPLQC